MDILRRKRGESGIVYCATRKAVEQVCDKLIRAGIDATRYHAGLSDEERKENQEKFQYDTCPVMVATNAFGMGIDKSNVRFVIHYQMPRSMEAYYQEAGRAGRDGEAAECILLYNGSDIFTAKWMIEHSEPNENMTAAEQSAVRYQDMNRLNRMVDYCTKPGCLRAFILRYFGRIQRRTAGIAAPAAARATARRRKPPQKRQRIAADGAHLGQQAAAKKVGSEKIEVPAGGDLFEQLRQVRLALSKLYHVAPFIICSDATLTSMVRRKPETLEGMRSVSGMGEIKTARYGEAFLQVIRPYVAQERKMKGECEAAGRACAVRRVPQPGAHRPQADAAQARLHAPARAGHPGHRLGQPERPGGTV